MALQALVTGSSGFTGRYLARELQKHGWEVWGLGQHDTNDQRYRQCDLSDSDRLQAIIADLKPDAVVHLAGIAFVGHGDPNDFYRVNLLGTRNLLASIVGAAATPKCVLLASSANVYGNATEGQITEAAPPEPVNDYAVSKLAMEHMARLWADLLPIVIARPFNYTGVGQDESFLLPKIVAHFRQRKASIELGNLDVERDFSDVRDVAIYYRRLIEECPAGETVNVCSGKTETLRGILELARSITGHNIDVRVNPAFVRTNEVKRLLGDPNQLHRIVGVQDRIPFENTLKWMLGAESC